MKDWKLYLLNFFLLFIAGYHILPDFSLQKQDFEKVSGILSLAKRETLEDGRSKDNGFKNFARKRLIINISDRQLHEYYITDIYEDYWDVLLNPNAIGQDIVLYIGTGKQQDDPFRIELDNAVVYDTDVRYYRNLLILLFTFALSFRNLFYYFKSDKPVDFTEKLQPLDHSFVGFVKRKVIGFRDYFLGN